VSTVTAPARRWSADLERARRALAEGADADGLYGGWYQGGDGTPLSYPSSPAYVAATANPVRFVGGWTVDHTDAGAPGALLVHGSAPSDQRVALPPAYIPAAGAHLAPLPGDPVLIDPLVTNESDGFWHVWSDRWRREGAPPRLRRVYLSARRGRETSIAAALFEHAPADDLWCAKCASGPHGGVRRDAIVIYLPKDGPAPAWQNLPDWVWRLVRATARLRDDDPPPLTGWIARGAGAAADPGGDESFGQAVCARLAKVARARPAALSDASAWRTEAGNALRPLIGDDADAIREGVRG
jgi:hypothetical protein